MIALSTAAHADPAPNSAAAAVAPETIAAGQGALITVVAGIVGYTRWPAASNTVRLCTFGLGRGVEQLLGSDQLGSAQRSVSVRLVHNLGEVQSSCDALYVGTVNAEASRDLLRAMVGRPVLLIGEGAGFCSDGGMFCLETATEAIRFHANLDAIARSGLRVNPLVLRMSRPALASRS